MRTPEIIIAGRAWPVPLLVPRQNRIVLPGLLGLSSDPLAQFDILLDVVFAALTRAAQSLSREEFEDWSIPARELIDALPTVALQTGFLKAKARASDKPFELPDWDAIIAQCCNFRPGTTEEYYEDNLTAPRLEAIQEEWRLHPPVALLVAGYLRFKPKPRAEEAVEELMRLFPTGRLTCSPTMH